MCPRLPLLVDGVHEASSVFLITFRFRYKAVGVLSLEVLMKRQGKPAKDALWWLDGMSTASHPLGDWDGSPSKAATPVLFKPIYTKTLAVHRSPLPGFFFFQCALSSCGDGRMSLVDGRGLSRTYFAGLPRLSSRFRI